MTTEMLQGASEVYLTALGGSQEVDILAQIAEARQFTTNYLQTYYGLSHEEAQRTFPEVLNYINSTEQQQISMEGSAEEIREYLSDRIQERLQDILQKDPNDPMQNELSMLYSDIVNNEMLSKEQVKWLENNLGVTIPSEMVEEGDC